MSKTEKELRPKPMPEYGAEIKVLMRQVDDLTKAVEALAFRVKRLEDNTGFR